MLCAALYLLEEAEQQGKVSVPKGPAGLAYRRKAIEPFERLWALACAHTAQSTNDLRGITYARRYLDSVGEEHFVTAQYQLLKSQSRTGGMATYLCLLTDSDLVLVDGTLSGRSLLNW